MANTQASFPFPTHNAFSLQRGSKMKMKMQVVVRATANKTKLNVGVETVPDETTLVQTTPNTLTYESGFLGVASSHRTTSPLNLSPAVPYLKKIITSKVYDVAIETPVDFASKLSHKMGVNIWLKREDLQPEVFSFKVRGAYNMMANLSTEQLRRGVICSSSSNHALGVAFAAAKLNCGSLVVMPATTPESKDMFEEKRSILEPAGALALAGAKAYCDYYDIKDETMVVVTTGANMNFGKLQLVTELADVGARREAVLATFNPEKPESLKKLCQLVGSINITEIRYRYDAEDGNSIVLYSVGYHKEVDFRAMEDRLEHAGLQTLNLTENDLATDHLRYLPGALMKFLDTFSPKWNITLFHYRAQGEMGANVLIGMQVAQCDRKEFAECVCNLGYEYEDEDQNEALDLLMA